VYLIAFTVALADTLTVCAKGCDHTDLSVALDAAASRDTVQLNDQTTWSLDGYTFTDDLTITSGTGRAVPLELSAPLVVAAGANVHLEFLDLSGSTDVLLEVQPGGDGSLVLSSIDDHEAGDSSSIVVDQGTLYLSNLSAVGTSTAGSGAVVNATGADVTIRHGTYTATSASTGGVVAATDSNVVIEHTTFLAPTASGDGGAVCVEGGSLELDEVTFVDPTAERGGAIAAVGTTTELRDVTVQGGSATLDGAAVWASGGTLEWLDGVVCDASGPSQLASDGSTVMLHSMTVRDGIGRAVAADGGELALDHLDLLGNQAVNGAAVWVSGVDAVLTNSFVAFQQGSALHLEGSSGSIAVSHTSFWQNFTDGYGAPGTDPVLGDPLVTWPGTACEAAVREAGSPLRSGGSDGRGVGDDDFDFGAPDTADTGQPTDTGNPSDSGRIPFDSSTPPTDDTAPFDMTGRITTPIDTDTGEPSTWTDDTGPDADTGLPPVHTAWPTGYVPGDTGMLTDLDSGETPGIQTQTGMTGMTGLSTGPNDLDELPDTFPTADTDTPPPTGYTATADTAATGSTAAATGDTGLPTDSQPDPPTGSSTADTSDPDTEPNTSDPTSPATEPATTGVPGFACTTSASLPSTIGWGVPWLLAPLWWRRRQRR